MVVVSGNWWRYRCALLAPARSQVRVTLIEPAQRFITCPLQTVFGRSAGWDVSATAGDSLRQAGSRWYRPRRRYGHRKRTAPVSGQTLRSTDWCSRPVWICAGMPLRATTSRRTTCTRGSRRADPPLRQQKCRHARRRQLCDGDPGQPVRCPPGRMSARP